ncbi:MAG: Gfo/Idh/MocA family oxidoreductase [Planctomycetes bacterium]|nr:Gfo/Idh/MocA family oxidoreductase [Planctomycetota bacterium]
MVKVGVIGLGFMGLTHLQVYLKHPKAKVVAVADQIKERLKGDLSGVQGNIMGPGRKFDFSKVKTYENAEDLLNHPEVDLVSVCLPTPAHAPIVKQALARGKHVLCEKPMAVTEAEVDAMVAAARASKGKLMVAQCIRFWPDYRKAREIVKSGSLGRVLAARFERKSGLPAWGGWLRDESKSGGAIVDLSIHDIDFAHHLLGIPESVRATGAVDLKKGFDHYQGTLRYGGAAVSLEGSWIFQGEYPFSMSFDILGEEGLLSFHSALNRPLTVYWANGRTERPGLTAGDGYFGEIDYFLSCIESGKAPELSPPEESAVSVKLALLLKESRRLGGEEMPVPEGWRKFSFSINRAP